MGSDFPKNEVTVLPKSPADGRTSGRISIGILNRSHSSLLHLSRLMSKRSVRDALVGSVACTRPPVSFQISQLSIVPASSLPFLATNAISGFLSSHSILVAEKYGSGRRPVRSAIKRVLLRSCSQRSVVRRSCQ